MDARVRAVIAPVVAFFAVSIAASGCSRQKHAPPDESRGSLRIEIGSRDALKVAIRGPDTSIDLEGPVSTVLDRLFAMNPPGTLDLESPGAPGRLEYPVREVRVDADVSARSFWLVLESVVSRLNCTWLRLAPRGTAPERATFLAFDESQTRMNPAPSYFCRFRMGLNGSGPPRVVHLRLEVPVLPAGPLEVVYRFDSVGRGLLARYGLSPFAPPTGTFRTLADAVHPVLDTLSDELVIVLRLHEGATFQEIWTELDALRAAGARYVACLGPWELDNLERSGRPGIVDDGRSRIVTMTIADADRSTQWQMHIVHDDEPEMR